MIPLPQLSENQLKTAELIISIFGFVAVLVTLLFGIKQYRRAEKWKRGEFIANAIKEFESNPTVRNALLMIDYGRRNINIFQKPDLSDQDGVRITRGIQWRALLPDTLKREFEEYRDASLKSLAPISPATRQLDEAEDVGEVFTPLEAKIRDSYDLFLDYLERFASLIELRLVTAKEFDPYLKYWIDAITKNDLPERSSTWRCTLLTYINFYGYPGVRSLFAAYGKDISPDGVVYKMQMEEMKKIPPEKTKIDRTKLADRLYSSIQEKPLLN
jgi:hypothetical protein